MLDVMHRALVIVGQAGALLTFVSLMVLPIVVGFMRHRAREQTRQEAEMAARAWARHHGGDPDYAGGLGQRVA